jgi:hypothetical protein
MLHVMNAEQKIKKYIKIAITLTVITFTELLVVTLHFLPPVLMTLLVVCLSLTKAYMVAWNFMHLNHERAWTRIVAMLPLGMVVYAGVLLADQKWRPISGYIDQPPRAAPLGFHSEAESGESGVSRETHLEGAPQSPGPDTSKEQLVPGRETGPVAPGGGGSGAPGSESK